MFALDSRLQQDTLVVGDFPLSRLLLMNDSRYPWFILVPRRSDVSELFQLDEPDRAQLWQETNTFAEVLKGVLAADKMNVATLGNVVSQLHMHVIARFREDAAWPAPVWGCGEAVAYAPEQVEVLVVRLKMALPGDFVWGEV